MIVYEATREIFINDVINNQIASRIEQLYRLRVGQNVNPREKEAWKNSMMYMNNVLNDVSIPNNSGIAIEFKIPYTSKRIDFIVTNMLEIVNILAKSNIRVIFIGGELILLQPTFV